MTDKKISQLTPITGADMLDSDELVVARESTSENFSVTRAELLQGSGVVVDDDFTSNGLLKRTAEGVYGIAVEDTDYQGVPAEGAFVDGDKTKLDGIEAGADVTDTANVTAAGALMDSEVANLAQVKAFDAADYATAAQGALAASAQQPPAEGAFVDGDKTKLDGIEAGADVTDTTNVTAAGALMDSELADITAVKALNQGVATTDSPTFAGGTFNGDIAVTGTVDGRDLAADGTKLDAALAITPLDYGATGDGSTDDTTAMQLWADELRVNGGVGYLPAGRNFKFSTLYLHPDTSYKIYGAGKDVSTLTIDNSDRTAVGLKFTHTDGSTRNAGEYELEGFTVQSATGNKACLVEHINSSAPKLHNIKVVAYTGTTALRYAQVYNGDFDDVDVWGAGHNVPFKETGSTTFSITTSGTTLTASASIFAAGDVGRKITLINGGTNETFTIAGYTSGTQVTVNAATVTASSTIGNFGGVRGSMTAASATLTLEADRLTSDDIGRVVYVLGAGPTVTGSSIPLRSTITAVSGTTITLDDAATATVTNAELIFDPAVDFGNTLNSYSDYTNDFSLTNLMIPQFRGTALVASGAGFNFHALKMHGVNSGVDELATNIQAMFSYFQGYISGRLEQSVCGNLGRIVIAGGRRGWTPSFDDLEISSTYGSPMFYGMDCNSGVVGLGSMKVIGDTDLDLVTDIHDDDGTVTFTRNGTIALYGASEYDAPTENETIFVDRVNGRLGVGTKFPSSNLDVRTAGVVSAQITSSGDSANFLIQAADGYVSRLWFGDATDYDVGAIEYAHTGNSMVFKTGGATRMTLSGTGLDMEGQLQFAPGSSVTPTNNGDVVFELTSNTTLTIKAKGSDGVVRSGTVTLS